MHDDRTLTLRWQYELKRAGVTLPLSHTWHNGEPLYRGD